MKPWTRQFLTAIAILIPLAFFFGAAASDPRNGGGPFGQSAAAWGQAIGTAVAILATGYYTTKQINVQVEQRRDDRVNMVKAIEHACDYAMSGLSSIDQVLPGKNSDAFQIVVAVTLDPSWSRPFREFIALPVDRWPTPFIYLRAVQFLQAYDAFEACVLDMAKLPARSNEHWKRAEHRRAELDAYRDLLQTACEADRNSMR